MNTSRINNWLRVLLALSGIALLVVLFVPMWRIELSAPQYPEGLCMLIYPDKVGGDVEIINGLNHYIGMKTIHKEDFVEFTVLPWIIGAFALLFVLIALMGRRGPVYMLTVSFALFGILAMVDFWKWEYDYGHNLDPNAAIVVPGMAYQPPLIGFKQLLNFWAYSVPDVGGWIFIGVGGILLLVVVTDFWLKKRMPSYSSVMKGIAGLFFIGTLQACIPGPEPIRMGKDQCSQCKMTLSNARFGAELVSKKGKVYTFDDIRCMKDFMKETGIKEGAVAGAYFLDFAGRHGLFPDLECLFLQSDAVRGPMGGNIAAFSDPDSASVYAQKLGGTLLKWESIKVQ